MKEFVWIYREFGFWASEKNVNKDLDRDKTSNFHIIQNQTKHTISI